MYAAVHAHPDGDSTVARMALTAKEYGYDGIVVRNHGDDPADYDADLIGETYDLDVVDGVEIRADEPSRASGFVGNHRDRRTIVAVHGGSPSINRFAVEQPAVDVLAHPMADDGDFNHVLARAAAENGVSVEFSLARVLRRDGGARVEALRDLRKLRDLVEQYDVPAVASADPRSHLQVRAPRELVALGDAVGLGGDTVASGLRAWGQLAERNRFRRSDSFVEPGVRICDPADGSDPGRPADRDPATNRDRPDNANRNGPDGTKGDRPDNANRNGPDGTKGGSSR